MYIDSHSHLNFNAFNKDWQEVAQRAFDSDVKGIVNVGSNLETSKKAIEIAGIHSRNKLQDGKLFAAVALHPVHVDDETFDIKKYEELANNESIVAIGETGIDLYHSQSTLEKQKEVFISSIKLANKNQLPVIIHNRNAKNEVLSILHSNAPGYGGVIHCFSEDWDYAKKILDLGLNLSFTATVTLNNIEQAVLDVVKNTPLNRMMIETDSPYIVPKRQKNKKIKRNEPAYVIEVAERIADIKNISVDEVAKQTTQNAIKFFGLK